MYLNFIQLQVVGMLSFSKMNIYKFYQQRFPINRSVSMFDLFDLMLFSLKAL